MNSSVEQLKIFIIGGQTKTIENEGEISQLRSFATRLGEIIGSSNFKVIVCSEHESSFDRYVLEGIAKSSGRKENGKIIIHRPDDRRRLDQLGKGDRKLDQRWSEFINNLQLGEPEVCTHIGPELTSREGFKVAFLQCQIAALEKADIIITVGGRLDSSAMMLLPIARSKRKAVLPFPFLGGAAENAFNVRDEELKLYLGVKGLNDLQSADGVENTISLIENLKGGWATEKPRVFISYSWKQASIADQVESILRRLDIDLFRDAPEIESGEDISARIPIELKKCTIFLVLWSIDYVESPHCFDELHTVLDSSERDPPRTILLRLDKQDLYGLFLGGSHQWNGHIIGQLLMMKKEILIEGLSKPKLFDFCLTKNKKAYNI